MNIEANKNKSDYALFLEKDINIDRKIKLYETDTESELMEKWKQEPLSYKSQQKIFDVFPNTALAEVIEKVHRFDKEAEIKTIADIYRMNAIPQNANRKTNSYIYKYELEDRVYYLQLKVQRLENEVKTLNNALCAMSEAVYNE